MTETKKPSGEQVRTRTVDTTVGAEEHQSAVKTVTQYVDRIEYRDRETKTQQSVDHPKDWVVQAMVGLDFKTLDLRGGAASAKFAFGAGVQRRVVGPVYGGLWGLSSGVGGIVVGVSF